MSTPATGPATDRRRRRWRPQQTAFVLVVALCFVLVAAGVGGRLARGGYDTGVSASGRCAGAGYAFTASRDDDGTAVARVRITTSRPGQPWTVQVTSTPRGGSSRELVRRTVAADENARIEVVGTVRTTERTRLRATISRSDRDPCRVEGTLG